MKLARAVFLFAAVGLLPACQAPAPSRLVGTWQAEFVPTDFKKGEPAADKARVMTMRMAKDMSLEIRKGGTYTLTLPGFTVPGKWKAEGAKLNLEPDEHAMSAQRMEFVIGAGGKLLTIVDKKPEVVKLTFKKL